jgi:hypothetical protein
VTVLEGEMEFEIAGHIHHPEVGEELLIRPGRSTRRGTSARPRHAGCTGTNARKPLTSTSSGVPSGFGGVVFPGCLRLSVPGRFRRSSRCSPGGVP